MERVTSVFSSMFTGEEEAEPTFEISQPYNFKHACHVQADPHSSTGFTVIIIFPRKLEMQTGDVFNLNIISKLLILGTTSTYAPSAESIWYF